MRRVIPKIRQIDSNQSNFPYTPFSRFNLRTPFFPFSFFQALTEGTSIPDRRLQEAVRNPVIQEAILLASPDLHAELLRWLEGRLQYPKRIDRLKYSLLRYLFRMSTRSTPFGLFAGISTGKVSDSTEIFIKSYEDYSRHTRLDMNYLCALSQDLAGIPQIKDMLRYYPNTSIYRVGRQLRFVEYRYEDKQRIHHIVAVDDSDSLQQVLKEASAGKTIEELSRILVDEDISLEEGRAFIDELIEIQVLVNDLEPAVTGPEFLDQILCVLDRIPDIPEIQGTIHELDSLFRALDSQPIGTTVSLYGKVIEQIKSLKTSFEPKYLFQTDMVKPTESCSLGRDLLGLFPAALEALNKLTPNTAATPMSKFKDSFFDRYETREVPLLQAMDLECGIGYPPGNTSGDDSPLVADIAIPEAGSSGSDVPRDKLSSLLLKKYLGMIQNKETSIEIRDDDLKDLQARWDDFSDTFSFIARILSFPADENPLIHIKGIDGGGAANLLGRFCHADQKVLSLTQEITAKEQELCSGKIYAEIIHLPESRIGNILLRPILRPYEIPYLARAAVPPKYQLRLDDLFVAIRDNRVVLLSHLLGKEIIPRLTTAHNYSLNSVPVYHFLSDLQFQARRGGLGFGWRGLKEELSDLPRVMYRNFILDLASWSVSKQDWKAICEDNNDGRMMDLVQAWRENHKVPPWVFLDDSDNELVINLENATCVRTLISVVHNRPFFQLKEFVFDPEHAVVKSRQGVFVNEFIFAFHRIEAMNSKIEPLHVIED